MGRAQREKHFVRQPPDIDRHSTEAYRVVLLGELKKRGAHVIRAGVRNEAQRRRGITCEPILHRSEHGTRACLIDPRHEVIITCSRRLHHGRLRFRGAHRARWESESGDGARERRALVTPTSRGAAAHNGGVDEQVKELQCTTVISG